jgi:prepilin peptidase CpaA
MTQTIAIWLLLALLAGAAAMDLWRLRIPNYYPLAVMALFLGWLGISATHAGIWQNAVMFGFTLIAGMALFARGWLGGGDVKLLAATALWFDFAGAAGLFLYVAVGGTLLSLVFIILRRILPASLSTNAPALKPYGPIPYGIAISGGAALAILGGGINPHPTPSPPAYAGFHYLSPEPSAKSMPITSTSDNRSDDPAVIRRSPEPLPPASGSAGNAT